MSKKQNKACMIRLDDDYPLIFFSNNKEANLFKEECCIIYNRICDIRGVIEKEYQQVKSRKIDKEVLSVAKSLGIPDDITAKLFKMCSDKDIAFIVNSLNEEKRFEEIFNKRKNEVFKGISKFTTSFVEKYISDFITDSYLISNLEIEEVVTFSANKSI